MHYFTHINENKVYKKYTFFALLGKIYLFLHPSMMKTEIPSLLDKLIYVAHAASNKNIIISYQVNFPLGIELNHDGKPTIIQNIGPSSACQHKNSKTIVIIQ